VNGAPSGTTLDAHRTCVNANLCASKSSPTDASHICYGKKSRYRFVESFAVYEHPSRKPLRYRGHDYRAPCCVHITICAHHRQPLFGTVSAAGMHLNDAGHHVTTSLHALHSDADGIAIDTHLVMPDHMHVIIVLGTNPHRETTASIPELVRKFKMRVMKSWPAGVRTKAWEPYEEHLWQRSYYDTLIRNDAHLKSTRKYILANPGRRLERYRL